MVELMQLIEPIKLTKVVTVLAAIDYTVRFLKFIYRQATKPRHRPKHLKRK